MTERNIKYKVEAFLHKRWFKEPVLKFAVVKEYEFWDNHICHQLSDWVKCEQTLHAYNTRQEAEQVVEELSKNV